MHGPLIIKYDHLLLSILCGAVAQFPICLHFMVLIEARECFCHNFLEHGGWLVISSCDMIFEQLLIIYTLKNFKTLLEAEVSSHHTISKPYFSSSQFIPLDVTAFHESRTRFHPSTPFIWTQKI